MRGRQTVWMLLLMPGWVMAGLPEGVTEKQLTRFLLPLPREVAVTDAVWTAASGVVVRVNPNAADLPMDTACRLAAIFQGTPATQAVAGAAFEIRLLVGDGTELPSGARERMQALGKLPNRDQAYCIEPLGTNGLLLAARSEPGLYYAAQTLVQLLQGSMRLLADRRSLAAGEAPPDAMLVPLVRVLDWPEVEERGQWVVHSVEQIKWMAHRKLNLVELPCAEEVSVTPDGRGHADIESRGWLEAGHLHAVRVVPYLPPLDELFGASDVFRLFPEVRARPAHEPVQGPDTQAAVACFAHERARGIVADWLADLGGVPGVDKLTVWLTEPAGNRACACATCKKEGATGAEIRAIVDGWRQARERHPQLGLRLVFNSVGESELGRWLAAVPPEVEVGWSHTGRTWTVTREPLFGDAWRQQATGRSWVGVYAALEPEYELPAPWTCPQFAYFRAREFVERKLRSVSLLAPAWGVRQFQIEAMAEWLWNPRGRDDREFAVAWATRQGLPNPEAFADWAVLLGPVEWELFGNGSGPRAFYPQAVRLIRASATAGPQGQGTAELWRLLPNEGTISTGLAACGRAQGLLERMGAPEVLVSETEFMRGYLLMYEKLRAMVNTLAVGREALNEAARDRMQQALGAFTEAGWQTLAAWSRWRWALGWAHDPGALDPEYAFNAAVLEIDAALRPLGVLNPRAAALWREVGTWSDEDFAEREYVRKRWEVTRLLNGAGRYEVKFVCGVRQACANGLKISRVALGVATPQAPEKVTELAVDEHEGVAEPAAAVRNVYTLDLQTVETNGVYTLIADLAGSADRGRSLAPAACAGVVLLRKAAAAPASEGTALPAGETKPQP